MKISACRLIVAATWAMTLPPAQAQNSSLSTQQQASAGKQISAPPLNQASAHIGDVADSAVGQIGQRQNGAHHPSQMEPMGRLNNRISNRVQNRISNRIDRHYDPAANGSSAFDRAAEELLANQKPR